MNARTRRDDVSTARRSTSRFIAVVVAAMALFVFTVVPSAAARNGGGGGGGKGQIHLNCTYNHSAPDDPIVFPNRPGASHVHDFFGNLSTNATSTLQTMQQSGTTCHLAADRSGYWAPALISPGGQAVNPTFLAAYYLAANGPVVPFPADLRMIAGAVSGSGMTDLTKFGYNCGEQGPNTSTTPPDCTGKGSVRANIAFPSCWDGRNIDSFSHRSHVAYPSGGKGCPSGWKLVPKIVLHIRYPVVDGTGYTLSSDAGMGYTSGMSVHADFWNVWDPAVLNQLVADCLNAGRRCDL